MERFGVGETGEAVRLSAAGVSRVRAAVRRRALREALSELRRNGMSGPRTTPTTPIVYAPFRGTPMFEAGLSSLADRFGHWGAIGRIDHKQTKPWWWRPTPRLINVHLGARSITILDKGLTE